MTSQYLKSDEIISRMAMAICWITDMDDERLVMRELTCAGFDADDIEQYASCAIVYAKERRKLFDGPNQVSTPIDAA